MNTGNLILNETMNKKKISAKLKKWIYVKIIKRLFDILISLFFIICFCWLYVIIGILVRINLGQPIIFRQERPGEIDKKTGKEKIFCLYKFRTMTDRKDENGNLLPDDERLTVFGKWLRSTSLDEIPEFYNILKGDMSLIGPRPLLVKYLDRYSKEQRHRHDVRPGITGFAQINGRNLVSWEDRFKMDVWYVENISFITDLKIFFETFKIVFKKEGITSKESVTMEEFIGNSL